MQRREDAAEFEAIGVLADQDVEFGKAMQHPALQLRHLLNRDPLRLVPAVKITEDETQRVAKAAVAVNLPLHDLITNAHVVGIVRRDDPETEDIGAMILDDLLRRNDVAEGFRQLAALPIHDEAV